ncbi:UNVERIFIED_CONTAM: hypothetical protein HHA_227320 [Hammondia hammondi]|eukprot:XP_008882097.1 hypothetical protein HHA_227320 [Hammondia hammondi]
MGKTKCYYVLTCQLSSPPPSSPGLRPSSSSSAASRCFLSVSARHEASGFVYFGRFPQSFIEEMTRRTGRFASMKAFWELLLQALRRRAGQTQSSKTDKQDVTLNLWDVTDLEALRRSAGGDSSSSLSSEDKHFIIITHRVDARKVHYPLALQRQGEKHVGAEASKEKLPGGERNAEVASLRGSPPVCTLQQDYAQGNRQETPHPVRSLSLPQTKLGTPRRLSTSQERGSVSSACESPLDGALPRLSAPPPVAAVEISSARSVCSLSPKPVSSSLSPRNSSCVCRETLSRATSARRSERREDSSRNPSARCHEGGAVEDARRLAMRVDHAERELHVTTRQLDAERHLRARETARLKEELDKARRTESALRNRIRELEATLRLTTFRPFRSSSASSLLPQSGCRSLMPSPRVSSAASSRRGSAATAPGVFVPGPKAASCPLPRLAGSTASRATSDSAAASSQRALSAGRFDAFRRRSPSPSRSVAGFGASASGVHTPGVAVRYVRRGGGALVPVPIDDSPDLLTRGRERRRSSTASFASSAASAAGRERPNSCSLSVDGGTSRGRTSRFSRPPLSRSASLRLSSSGLSPQSSLCGASPRPAFSSVSSRGGPALGASLVRGPIRRPSPVRSFSSPRPASRPLGGQALPGSPSRVWGKRDSALPHFGDSQRSSRQQLLRGVDCKSTGAVGGFQGQRLRASLQEPASSVFSSRGVSASQKDSPWALSRRAARGPFLPPGPAYIDDEEGLSVSNQSCLHQRSEGDRRGAESLHAPNQAPPGPLLEKGDSRGDSAYVMIPVAELKRLLRSAPDRELEEQRRHLGGSSSLPLEASAARTLSGGSAEHASRSEPRKGEMGLSCEMARGFLAHPRDSFGEHLSVESQDQSSEFYANPPGQGGGCLSKGDTSLAISEARLPLLQGPEGGAATPETLEESKTRLRPVAFCEETEGPLDLLEDPADVARYPRGVGKVSLPHLLIDCREEPGSLSSAGCHLRKRTAARERGEKDERGAGQRSTARLADSPCVSLSPYPGESEEVRETERLEKEAFSPQTVGCLRVGEGERSEQSEDRKGFVPFSEKMKTEGGHSAYSEIDRRLSALQEFLKSTRNTFKMLERAENSAP